MFHQIGNFSLCLFIIWERNSTGFVFLNYCILTQLQTGTVPAQVWKQHHMAFGSCRNLQHDTSEPPDPPQQLRAICWFNLTHTNISLCFSVWTKWRSSSLLIYIYRNFTALSSIHKSICCVFLYFLGNGLVMFFFLKWTTLTLCQAFRNGNLLGQLAHGFYCSWLKAN